MTDLGTPSGQASAAIAVNARGQIVGWSETATGEQHATLWQDGEVIDLGTLPGGSSAALWASTVADRLWALPTRPRAISTPSSGRVEA